MKMRLLGIIVLACLCVVGCRLNKDVYSPTNTFAAAGNTDIATKNVRQAIINACTELKWSAFEKEPGVIIAKLVVRTKHSAVVRISYTNTSYAMKYEDSTNLEYKVKSDGSKSIHPNYNKWVGNLQARINANINQLNK